MLKPLIFTDLDGTLLNHHTYEYEVVKPVIERLKTQGIQVVLNSSKTLSELAIWQQRLAVTAPIIAENGGVIQFKWDENRRYLLGTPYADIRSFIKHLRKANGWKFEGFGDWTVAEVMNHTGLKSADAVRAKEREVTEPILWQDSEENFKEFEKALKKEGLLLKKGGRFHHVMGQHDKADAMRYLTQLYTHEEQLPQTLALGDGGNDLAMLQAADIAVVMPPAKGQTLQIDGAYYAQAEAPWGWVEAVNHFYPEESLSSL